MCICCFCKIEFDALRRLGIEAPEDYATKYFCDSSKGVVERMSTCVVGEIFLKGLEGAVEDLQSSGSGWLDCLVSSYLEACENPSIHVMGKCL